MIPLEYTKDRRIAGGGAYAHPERNRAFFDLLARRRYHEHGVEKGPLVGDYYLLPGDDPATPGRRFTYDWGETIQGSDPRTGSFHLWDNGRMDYSGSLTGPMPKSSFRYAGRVAKASCWIFDDLWPRAHAGVIHEIYVRVWAWVDE